MSDIQTWRYSDDELTIESYEIVLIVL